MEKITPTEATGPLIELSEVEIAPTHPGSSQELTAINWSIFPETFWVVAGTFGSGKSDLLATAAGLQRPLRGHVKLFGRETFTVPEDQLVQQRRRIGLVFSGGGRLFNRLTVAENIALPLRYHENFTETEAENAVREVMELMELIPFARRIPSTLSVNWQQRAALARALILQPEILLLDRPLLGMDLRHQRWALDFLTKLSEGLPFCEGRRVTLVATTEDIAPWKTVARQFAVLRNNRWQEIGGRAELDASSESLLHEVWADES